MTEQWTWIERISCMGVGYDAYINEAGTHIKNVWDDGYVEIYERA